ncbi:MAG: ATP-binding cassette domain-containing protein [Bacteroidota bacterium]
MSTPVFNIELIAAGKKFFRNWIFKNLSFTLSPADKVSVIGQNGSGKSTLLQVLSGYESLSTGNIRYSKDNVEIPRENIYNHIAIAAPYLELIEEYTLEEIVRFHFQLKKPIHNLTPGNIIELMQLEGSKDKIFKYFSSGMKQRTKLTLAIMSDVDLILLDEPLSNLDKTGTLWYQELTSKYLKEKSVVVCSNQNEAEYAFCNRSIFISDYQ